ncbi:MAG: ABC transporter ATP-binding protein/permease [Lachnospiraceae bacterium]|nr:ABC transporter ATP-binding protein/permease [Lachnospiraceae bacterium]
MIKSRLFKLMPHAKKQIAAVVFFQWLALIMQVVIVYEISGILSLLINEGRMNTKILRDCIFGGYGIRLLLIFVLAAGLRFYCDKQAAKASYQASAKVKQVLRQKIYQKLLCLGTSYKERVSTAEVVQLCMEGVEQMEVYFGKYLPQLFYSLLAPLTLFLILVPVNIKTATVLLVCVPLIPISIVAVQKIAKRLLNRYWSVYTSLGDSFLENLQGLTTLKIYQADEQKSVEMDNEAANFRKITMKVLTMQLNSTSVMDIVAYGGAAVGMIVAAGEFFAGNINAEETLLILLLASEFFIPLRILGSFFHIAMNGMAASDKMFALLDIKEPKKGSLQMHTEPEDIFLKNLHFAYDESREILKGIEMEIPAGKMISIVGESGCGKSTVAGLLSGKNKSYQGSIIIGGKEISDINEQELMRYITSVRHNSYLFKGTVEENLRMAKEGATKQELEEVLKRVNLYDFLWEQQGLLTKLTERGGNLSGGQCQRLAIARALLHDTPVYIFDEATSNIDAESENMIMQVILELAKTKIVLLISHRLSNVTGSDCIYFLAEGEIKEQGSHEELMQKNGVYKKLYEKQTSLENYGRA